MSRPQPAVYRFRDRGEAGDALARALVVYAGRADVLVLGLPRGGVPVAGAVAERLGVPLDVLVARKLGMPGYEEVAMGAIAGDWVTVLNPDIIEPHRISPAVIARVAGRERTELHRRESAYRAGRPPLDVRGRIVILVDDGMATGATMLSAVRAVRTGAPRSIVVAVPVASREGRRLVEAEADAVIALVVPDRFSAVGTWYEDFPQVSDAEVLDALALSTAG